MKIKKIFFVNCLICSLLFFSLEYVLWSKEIKPHNIPFFVPYFVNPVESYEKGVKEFIVFRPIKQNSDFVKKPIILFGCSYTYGVLLNDEETFSAKLQNYTKRVVYNKAMSCFSVQNMLYFLQDGIEKEIRNPEYIFYTFMNDHIHRLYVDCLIGIPCALFYKYKDNKKSKLVQKNNLDLLYWHSYSTRKLKSFLYEKNMIASDIEKEKFLLIHLLEANRKINEIYPNSKFVVFVYDGDSQILPIVEDLKLNGIEVLFLKDLTDENIKEPKYVMDELGHPSPFAWDLIVPLLAKKLKL